MSSRPTPSLPLRWHLVRLTVGTLLPILAFATVVAFQLAHAERQAAERRVMRSAHVLASTFERELFGSIHTLQALATSDALAREDWEAFFAECERVRRTQPSWKAVALIRPDGQFLFNTSHPLGTALPPPAEPESFARIVTHHQPTVGRLARGRTDAAQLAFPVRVPVMREGGLRYVLSAIITPEALHPVVAYQPAGEEEWTRSLVDPGGLVAARSRAPEHFVGQSASRSFLDNTGGAYEDVYADTSLEGDPVYVAFSHSQTWGWTAAVVSPRWALDAPVVHSMLVVGGLGLLLLLVSAGGAWLFSRRIERSIAGASTAAAALAQGEPPRSEPSSVTELARLGEALERSGQLLRERERERDTHLTAAESARAEAVAATQAKDAFLAMLGHELRNPLAPIVTSMELLRARGLAHTPEHEVISRQLRHVVRLVDDLLDVSRITHGQLSLHREPLELAAVVERAVEATRPLILGRGHALEVEVPPSGLWLLADPDRLTQVVANLLTNAAKYTPPGGRIRARAHAQEREVSLAVEDDGPGIPEELRPRIFEAFVQGPRTLDRSEGGLGIGLALVRTLVEAHGGRIEVRGNGTAPGSTFTLWLPRHVPVEAPSTASQAPPERTTALSEAPVAPDSRSLRVLVVDDNVDAAELLAELLELNGCEVALAHGWRQALSQCESFQPQLVLLDIGLPEVDGYGVAERIRERLGGAGLVFAALTGFGQEQDRLRSREAGFVEHFVKPIDMGRLMAFLESLRPGRRGAA